MAVVMPPMVPGEPVRISASTFVTWQKCPESANARIQGRFPEDTRAAFAGSLAHRVFSRHLQGGQIAPEEFAQVCRQEIGASNLNFKMGGLEMGRMSALTPMIEEVRALYQRFVRFPATGFSGAEVDLRHELVDERVELVGTVDAVFEQGDGGYRLVDWKTGDLGEPADQLGFYSLLWALGREVLPVAVEAVSVRTGDVFRATPSWDGIRETAEEVARMVSQLRGKWHSGDPFPRVAGPWCRYCPVLDDCPEGQAVGELLA